MRAEDKCLPTHPILQDLFSPDQRTFVLAHTHTLVLIDHPLQAQFCSQSMDTITKDTDRDFFMSPQEAIEYGLIDAIIAKPLLLQTREIVKPKELVVEVL